MSYGARFLGSVSVLTTILWFIFFITRNEASGASVYYSPKALGVSNYDQLNSLFKDYLKVLEKLKTGKPKHISGQVNLRPARSELVGDMAHALRLYQLAELDRMYGAKSRPRFGKRAEVTQEIEPAFTAGYDSDSVNLDVPERTFASHTYEDRSR